MKFLLNIYDHGVVMLVKFHQGVIPLEEGLSFNCLHFNDFFHLQPLLTVGPSLKNSLFAVT